MCVQHRYHLIWALIVIYFAPSTITSITSCDKSRKVLTDSWGIISDGPIGENYTHDTHCEWLIKANSTNQFITLKFVHMSTECSYDYVFVYDGFSFQAPLLGTFSGKNEPQTVVASSGYMLILLYSDTNYMLDGFRAEYSITNCSANCTNHGQCVEHTCICDTDWGGPNCRHQLCANQCSGHGDCVEGQCLCQKGFVGQYCSLFDLDKEGNRWHFLSEFVIEARTSHSAVYVDDTDALYVFGGFRRPSTNHHSLLECTANPECGWCSSDDICYGRMLSVNCTTNLQTTRCPGICPSLSSCHSCLIHSQDTRPLSVAHKLNLNQCTWCVHNAFVQANGTRERIAPAPRFEHAACRYPGGFLLYGGKLSDGRLSNELWLYNVTSRTWSLRAQSSLVTPPALSKHTLTYAPDTEYVYVLGGSKAHGEFSAQIFAIKLSTVGGDEQWQELIPRGGQVLDFRVTAHSTVYDVYSKSLLVYGGILTQVARFSKISDKLFIFNVESRHYSEVSYPRAESRDTYVPRERAFHSATIVGNYMVIFGGYTHRHNQEEICYDNQMYLYHLGCHTWVNDDILGSTKRGNKYPKQQGVFGHTADVRRGNTLLLMGGYHGNVNADLIAFTFPPTLAPAYNTSYEPEHICSYHHSLLECTANPECGWCSSDDICYGRMLSVNCTTNLQTTRCPGICPSLSSCHSCLIHSQDTRPLSVAHKLNLNQCTWCVHNARCHHKGDDYGVCGLQEDTPSQEPGWWGSVGTEVTAPSQCRLADKTPGLTFLKYAHPANFSQPDHVTIVNSTSVEVTVSSSPMTRTELSLGGETLARLHGYIHPGAGSAHNPDQLQACIAFSSARLKMAPPNGTLELLANISSDAFQCFNAEWPGSQLTTGRYLVDFESQKFIAGSSHALSPSRMRLQVNRSHESPKVFTFEYLEPYEGSGECEYHNCLQCLSDASCAWCDSLSKCFSRSLNESQVCVDRNVSSDFFPNVLVFTFEYLEPYEGSGECEYHNCLQCLSDASCAWCDSLSKCFSRSLNESQVCVDQNDPSQWYYMILHPGSCPACAHHITCLACTESGLCEWWPEDARCERRGRYKAAVTSSEQCLDPCHDRVTCDQCLHASRCVWCAATQECFLFSVYISEYQMGRCREWLDRSYHSGIAGSGSGALDGGEICQSCSRHSNCSSCLSSLGCGWCYDFDNPIQGACVPGDFNTPYVDSCAVAVAARHNISVYEEDARWSYSLCPDVDECGLGLHDCHKDAKCTNGILEFLAYMLCFISDSCAVAVAARHNISVYEEDARWSYSLCPDVDECGLGLHDCHKDAKCTNTHGSYSCQCKRGFHGDGKTSCTKTCYNKCIYGYCKGPPDYSCQCELGWTGVDCSVNCLCNNHSTCVHGIGICDECHDWTTGDHCQYCRAGSYGNATTQEGCRKCDCNSHGNSVLGVCDSITGECICQDNTQGKNCERCLPGYYGDPTDGGTCYYQCMARGMLTGPGPQGLGSGLAERNAWEGKDTPSRECLWIIGQSLDSNSTAPADIILLRLQPDINVPCNENAVYIYDGLPDFVTSVGGTHQSTTLGVFCTEDMHRGYEVLEAKSGVMTIHYKQGKPSEGFNATYQIFSCPDKCPENRTCINNQCVCPPRRTGPDCQEEICPNECHEFLNHGTCDLSDAAHCNSLQAFTLRTDVHLLPESHATLSGIQCPRPQFAHHLHVYRPPGQTFRTGDGILTSPIHQPLGVTYLAVVSRRSAVLIITGIPRVRSVIIAEVFIGAFPICNAQWLMNRRCQDAVTCTECLARWPIHWNQEQPCKWCANCGRGHCIPESVACDSGNKCTSVRNVNACKELQCAASDCNKCQESSSCFWTRQVMLTAESGLLVSSEPIYDWNCAVKTDANRTNIKLKTGSSCPLRCDQRTDCQDCLTSSGGEGGWHECRWSSMLNECISPSYEALYCAGGVCGLVLGPHQAPQCPRSCSAYTQCSTCLRHAHCGWCALQRDTTGGMGVCTEGSLNSPSSGPESSTCDILFYQTYPDQVIEVNNNDSFSWNYVKCPPENECLNDHHTCDPQSEQCVDLADGFECVCGRGYNKSEEGGECVPVCSQGCVRGVCSEPDKCQCDFGYVGVNCSIQCQCNGHADCAGPDKLDVCLRCHNHTKGPQCDKCEPLYVGDPRDNGECVPCSEYCNGHTGLCINASLASLPFSPESGGTSELAAFLDEGPTTRARCMHCGNHTTGPKCEDCVEGYFRGSHDLRAHCRPCECHGHGNTCDPVSGEKCNCGNNTESDPSCQLASKNANQACFQLQCSRCKDSYTGTPTNGHQCYKVMNVDARFCLDSKLLDECKMKPKGLNPGQSVFFALQPRFMNVDIRVSVDVTQGSLDLYLSPRDDTLVVNYNTTLNSHVIGLDPKYDYMDIESIPGLSMGLQGGGSTTKRHVHMPYRIEERVASGLSTFITVGRNNTILIVRNITHRLVLTLPQDRQDLSNTRFYLALVATHLVPKPAYGVLFFRQDQLHIDLFVFFSVFFSCFFLFLASCVVAWKAKQAADLQRARRRHVVEMMTLARRPFATVSVCLASPHHRRRGRSRGGGGEIRPVALEPTGNALAAVSTIFVKLPGGRASPVKLALASSLITLARSNVNPAATRPFLRRRNERSYYHGVLFFRQDQLHIDLFVFFSVFFSCFFLFLASCVVAWKAKQAADLQRARRRHVVEMMTLARRPFATVSVCLASPHHRRRGRSRGGGGEIRPVALEPTGNALAAVSTIFVKLPGGRASPVKLALASSLITLARSNVNPAATRPFLRRRNERS
ncbi:multiple epidermal growth factor-like domains protein 8 [Diaphorina citri]|uniref:Multiple epidermal growth factor-like domains protein 8 n=1 Tax=Diaphorina citri TaxID=121845 RepID=A0A3Q0IV98_DIACI|nr:multiple epidermal growth factor-like domains protein 8 [Diaphorina citri]